MLRCAIGVLISFQLLAAVDGARIDAVLSRYDRPGSPGCVLAVLKDGRLIHRKASGAANLEHGIPLGPRSVFEIASASKTFTALAVLLLEKDGKLSLEDQVRRFIPELPEYGRTIRIRHLLTHTSGLRDAIILVVLAGRTYDDTTTWPELLVLISRQKELNFQPGEDVLYSNTGYLLAAEILKRVTGRTLRQFADERIFGQLGMKDTHYIDDRWEVVPRKASGCSPQESGFKVNNSGAVDKTGAAGVHTTIEDMERWEAEFARGGDGFAPLIARMQEPTMLDNGARANAKLGDTAVEFGIGLMRERWGRRTLVEQGGTWAGYRSGIYGIPEERLSVICLCKENPPWFVRNLWLRRVP